jgi:hypothetical protein
MQIPKKDPKPRECKRAFAVVKIILLSALCKQMVKKHLAALLLLGGAIGLVVSGCVTTRYFEDGRTDEQATETATADQREDGGATETEQLCSASLADRISVTEVAIDEAIHYLRPGYNIIAVPARVILARRPNGDAVVAWLNAEMDEVHVTPLDADLNRDGDDVRVDGHDLGGIVAHDDGFTLLTRRPDTGDPVAVDDADAPAYAAVLVRYADGAEQFAVPLTGTDGVDGASDYSNFLRGQLQERSGAYGAYFEVRSGVGTTREGLYGDKLVVLDEAGDSLSGGWRYVTGTVTDLSLFSTPDGFTALALADSRPDAGLILTRDPETSTLLAPEETWNGYVGGELGGVAITASNGYGIAWASRGYDIESGEALGDAHDIAFLRLAEDLAPLGTVHRLTDTETVDEVNVHVAPYGEDTLLVVWNRVTHLDCRTVGTCFGEFDGTYAQLISWDGSAASDQEAFPWPPTSEQSMVRFDNGDLAYAFVTESPDYSERLDRLYEDGPPAKQIIKIARLRFCEEGRGP